MISVASYTVRESPGLSKTVEGLGLRQWPKSQFENAVDLRGMGNQLRCPGSGVTAEICNEASMLSSPMGENGHRCMFIHTTGLFLEYESRSLVNWCSEYVLDRILDTGCATFIE